MRSTRLAMVAYRRSPDRKSTRLNSSHVEISYAVFCLKKKTFTPEGAGRPLQLSDFQPPSILHLLETKAFRSRHPVIGIHNHLSFTAKSTNTVGIVSPF